MGTNWLELEAVWFKTMFSVISAWTLWKKTGTLSFWLMSAGKWRANCAFNFTVSGNVLFVHYTIVHIFEGICIIVLGQECLHLPLLILCHFKLHKYDTIVTIGAICAKLCRLLACVFRSDVVIRYIANVTTVKCLVPFVFL